MELNLQSTIVVIDGRQTALGVATDNPLVRAVIISLFTWRRANPDDDLPGNERMGWWGDSYPTVAGDKIGSRLWLLLRSGLTNDTIEHAREYAQEALQWLVDDGVAAKVEATAERVGVNGLALGTVLYHQDGKRLLDLRFDNVWEFLNV